MRPSLQEVQQIEWNILKAFHDYCEEHHLRYVLGYGTLLGAVRHEGFIPWDNDIDVFMPRSDYCRFLETVKDHPVADHLYVQHYSLDKKYHYMCARICDARTKVHVPYIREQPSILGLWIDIFPLDGVAGKSVKSLVQKLILKWYWMLFRADVYGSTRKNSRNPFNYYVKMIALKLFPNKNNAHNYTIDRICQWYPFDKCRDSSFMFGEEGICRIPREDFEGLIKLKFGNDSFYCPIHYKDFLQECYGDYMTLPREEDRITHDIDVTVAEE